MYPYKKIEVRSYERAGLFRKGEFVKLLGPGTHWILDAMRDHTFETYSLRSAAFRSENLDLLIKANAFGDEAKVVELGDRERALVWIDGVFCSVLSPGRYVFWTEFVEVRIEVVSCDDLRFSHADFDTIVTAATSSFDRFTVADGHVGLLYESGKLVDELASGRYAFWRGRAPVNMVLVDLRQRALELCGQELMTADKVTLRINALMDFRVVDARKAATEVQDYQKALYREGQLALRSLIGSATLDEVLAKKSDLASEAMDIVQKKVMHFGVVVSSVGIKDVILPGDMRELLNKVTEAKKAAEASVITRREETAAIRSQLNSAKLIENNPTMMRLRELETLERIVEGATLSVVAGDEGLDRKLLKLI